MKLRMNLMVIFYVPVLVALLRILLTLAIFIWNTMEMPMRWLQIIPLGVLVCSIFLYLKLYSDGDPIISLLLPSIIHIVLASVFSSTIVILPFIPTLLIDAIYLTVKGVKASAFPFEIEGEDEGIDDYEDLEV